MMESFFSSESDMQANTKLKEIAFPVMDYLQPAFLTRSLKDSNIELNYIPIVMGEKSIHSYPARSRVIKKNMIFDCCPQLAHTIFVNGTFNQRLRAYLDGLLMETPDAFRKLGATDAQIEDFKAIMDECYQALKK